MNSRQDLYVSSLTPAATGGKRPGSPTAPELDVCKCLRRMVNIAEEAPRAPTSSTTLSSRDTLIDTGHDRGDDASGEVSPHGTEGSHARQVTPEAADVSATAYADLVHEVNRLRETLAQTHSALEAVHTCLQVLEQQQPRIKG